MVWQTILVAVRRTIWTAIALFGAYLVSPSLSQSVDIDAKAQQVVDLFLKGDFEKALPIAQQVLSARESALGPDNPEVEAARSSLAMVYYALKRYSEAEPLLLHVKADLEKSAAPDDVKLPYTLNILGDLYRSEGRYADAQLYFERALAIRSKVLAPDSLELSNMMNQLGDVYYTLHRYDDAAALYVHTLAIREKALGSDNLDVANTLNSLANLYSAEAKYGDAEPLFKRVIAIREKILGHNSQDVAAALKNLGGSYSAQGRYADAELYLKEALAIQEQVLGPDHIDIADTLSNLANVYSIEGHHSDAGTLLGRALSIQEKVLGPNHPDIAGTLNRLAIVYQSQGRHDEAESAYQRALHIQEIALGPNSPDLAVALGGLGTLYTAEQRFAEAEALFKRALKIQQNAYGPDNPQVLITADQLAQVYIRENRFTDAEPLLQRSLAVAPRVMGPNHPMVAFFRDVLAKAYLEKKRYQDAEPLLKQALTIQEQSLGPDHYMLAYPLNTLGMIYTVQGRYAEAETLLRRSLTIEEKYLNPRDDGIAEVLGLLSDLFRSQGRYVDSLPIVQRMIANDNAETATALPVLYGAMSNNLLSREDAMDESLTVVQQASHTSAGDAINDLAARLAMGDGRLAQVVRQDQDLAAEADRLQGSLVAAVSADPSRRNTAIEQNTRDRISAVFKQRKDIERDLIQEFPDFTALSMPQPLAVKGVQSLLADDEAVIVINLGTKSYIWAITNNMADWKELSSSDTQVSDQVTILRSLLNVANPKPFDAKLSFNLYETILGPVEALIRSKLRLSFIVNGALLSLPPQVFVTSDPAGKPLGKVQWIIRSHAVTLLPSLASLKVLRIKVDTAAQKPLIGFADPIFDAGVDANKSNSRIAGDVRKTRATRESGNRIAELRRLKSTADELRKVAASLKASADDIFVGRNATETQVKQAKLEQYRVIYFATHALLANQTADVANINEPALVLTQPQKPSDFDNGLLTETEVALLKLDAEWVVLSACDTAAGDKPDAESLSGLARAFFYAGARSLLVSNWDVETNSAVQLMEGTFAALAADSSLSHGEALRKSMLAMIDHKRKRGWDDPKFWAPFVVVGEPEKASVKRKAH